MLYRLKLSVVMLGQYHFDPVGTLEIQIFYFFILLWNNTFLEKLFICHMAGNV